MNKAKILSIIAFVQGVTIIVLCICLDLQRRANEFSVRQLNEMLAMQPSYPTDDYEEGFSDGAECVIEIFSDGANANFNSKAEQTRRFIQSSKFHNFIQTIRPASSTSHESK